MDFKKIFLAYTENIIIINHPLLAYTENIIKNNHVKIQLALEISKSLMGTFYNYSKFDASKLILKKNYHQL